MQKGESAGWQEMNHKASEIYGIHRILRFISAVATENEVFYGIVATDMVASVFGGLSSSKAGTVAPNGSV